ncbi:MAG: exonuclease domain-containing protein [Candidatus Omnitrophica bacterium]|nr:exonuclease domain-containing protein [Candidatus Omnitrophota bacterium]
MIEGAPEIESVLPKFLEFAYNSCLCSYNAIFDMEFLNNELKLIGRQPLEGIDVIDILKMARRLLPGLEGYTLIKVADNLGIKTIQQHRAFSDVELTLKVFQRLLGILKAKGVSDFENSLVLFGINSKVYANIINQRIAQIQEAIDLGVRLKIKYLSSHNAEVTEREVIPREIKHDRNYTYLVSFCSLRNDERTFRIDGILHLEII